MSYNEQTIKTLGEVLAPSCLVKYRIIFADMLKSIIIPWNKKETILSKSELIPLVTQAVCDSFKPYTGSHIGYSEYEKERKLLYTVLWGQKRGLSLMNEDFINKPVTCTYDNEIEKFIISYLPDSRPVAYSELQLKWCKENAPKEKQDLSDAEITGYMYPAWLNFGSFNAHLPQPIPTSDEQKEFINKLFTEE